MRYLAHCGKPTAITRPHTCSLRASKFNRASRRTQQEEYIMLKELYLWHPIFVHFSVALLSAATGFYVLATLFKKNRFQPQWLAVAHWNFGVGLGMTVLTLLFGWLAFNSVDHNA